MLYYIGGKILNGFKMAKGHEEDFVVYGKEIFIHIQIHHKWYLKCL